MVVAVKNLRLTAASADGNLSIDLSDISLSALVAAIAADPAYSSALIDSGSGALLARGLTDAEHEATAGESLSLGYPQNLLYHEIRTAGWLLDEQTGQIKSAERQMYMNTAEEAWLDYWARDFFGVARYVGESDEDYGKRTINELIRSTQNNKALELIILDALGVDTTILDAWPVRADLAPEDQPKAPGHFLLEMQIPNDLSPEEAQVLIDRIKDAVRKYKAAGTDFMETVLRQFVQQHETLTVGEAMAVAITATFSDEFKPGPIYCGAAWQCGTPGLYCGTNDAIKEQVVVRVLNAGDDSVEADYLYGG